MTGAYYPKILVITEEPPRENSLGFGRTLTNILKDYPSDKILYYVSDDNYAHTESTAHSFSYISFGFQQ